MPLSKIQGIEGQVTPNLSHRNLVINGAMQVAQRGTVTGATDGTYGGPDRFSINETGDLVVTLSQDTDTPTGSGFSNSMKIDVTTADSSLAAGDFAYLGHRFEGQDLQLLKKGTSSAESVTLSFWIKTSVTGTYILQIYDNDNSRHISKSYTVSSADTWEHKTITFAGDTTGTLDDDNAYSLQLYWWLAAGSTYTAGTLATSWASFTSANAAVGQVNAINSTSNNIYITGVQLELGETATPFEHRSYGDELFSCQRYYSHALTVVGVGASTTSVNAWATFPRQFRATPTYSASGALNFSDGYSTDYLQSSGAVGAINGAPDGSPAQFLTFSNFSSANVTQGRFMAFPRNLSNNNRLVADAEL